ncbi:hypothetical protein BpHYR1_011170 [Brachionus plicatilis]|uniref:Uncharacterized protein n=1 Tax=Brachionus plicatilis TaxID=10195 RepID=A0A3M7PVU9_BRAPC|nr:hypothetical protein BpHYR1_011170 [Brachionus plicatilis]
MSDWSFPVDSRLSIGMIWKEDYKLSIQNHEHSFFSKKYKFESCVSEQNFIFYSLNTGQGVVKDNLVLTKLSLLFFWIEMIEFKRTSQPHRLTRSLFDVLKNKVLPKKRIRIADMAQFGLIIEIKNVCLLLNKNKIFEYGHFKALDTLLTHCQMKKITFHSVSIQIDLLKKQLNSDLILEPKKSKKITTHNTFKKLFNFENLYKDQYE